MGSSRWVSPGKVLQAETGNTDVVCMSAGSLVEPGSLHSQEIYRASSFDVTSVFAWDVLRLQLSKMLNCHVY